MIKKEVKFRASRVSAAQITREVLDRLHALVIGQIASVNAEAPHFTKCAGVQLTGVLAAEGQVQSMVSQLPA